MSLSFEDKLEIQELTNKYANAMDSGDLTSWLDTWDDAGVWQGGLGSYEGKENLKRLLPDLGERIKGKRHIMANFVIEGTTEEAHQTCYLMVIEAVAEPRVVATAVYKDKLKHVNGKWKFTHRQVTLDRAPAPVNSKK